MKSKRILITLTISLFLIMVASSRGLGWSLVKAKIKADFPEVKRITPAELAAWLQDPGRPAPLLLDVRTRPEYEVSHLARAEQVEPDAAVMTIHAPKDRPIVTYCSVGYRSSAFAEKLRAAGFSKIVNLEGSIFAWANEGRPLFRGDAQVAKVHPYNRPWGLLLRKEHRADAPSIEKEKP